MSYALRAEVPKRYSKPREYIDWYADEICQTGKMLAWALYVHDLKPLSALNRHQAVLALEGAGSYQEYFWLKFATYIEACCFHAAGVRGMTMDKFIRHIWATQRREVTVEKLMQRADKAQRYLEFNPLQMKVLEALQIVKRPCRGRSFSDVWIQLKANMQGGRCHYCDREFNCRTTIEGDHAIPVTCGGLTVWENLRVACRSCNQRKRDMTEEEFFDVLSREKGRRYVPAVPDSGMF